MPPLGMHMTLARELASQINHAAIDAQPGLFYLGASAPDIRAMTRQDRRHTHFFDLDDFEEQSGAARLFQEHPELANARSDETAAFLCGYLSHLEMDEAWITDVYRPCFGERSPLKGDVLANVLDRVLQHELDRREIDACGGVDAIRDELLGATVREVVGFIDDDDLTRWREVAAEVLCRERTWERFGRFAGRHLKAYGVIESEDDISHFLRNVPDLLDQSIREVTQERLESFRERARRRAVEAAREFLS